MSAVTLEEGTKALEDRFSENVAAQALDALRAKKAERLTRDELRKSSGIADDEVLDRLIALGLTTHTIVALSLIPLIEVAWADGVIQDKERDAILLNAHCRGLEEGGDGHALLQGWLRERPDPALTEAWEAYVKALSGQLNLQQNILLQTEVTVLAKKVAAAGGGFLGRGKVSPAEEKVLARIEAAFTQG